MLRGVLSHHFHNLGAPGGLPDETNAQQRFTASSNDLFHAKPQGADAEVGRFKTTIYLCSNEM